MFVRFVVDETDPDSGMQLGIFQAMYRLWRSGALATHEEKWWDHVRAWFNLQLEEPDRLARANRPNPKPVAVSWFKDTATEHIAKAREVAALLEQHDIRAHMLRTNRPGYIVYEDAVQVSAEPFRQELR